MKQKAQEKYVTRMVAKIAQRQLVPAAHESADASEVFCKTKSKTGTEKYVGKRDMYNEIYEIYHQ